MYIYDLSYKHAYFKATLEPAQDNEQRRMARLSLDLCLKLHVSLTGMPSKVLARTCDDLVDLLSNVSVIHASQSTRLTQDCTLKLDLNRFVCSKLMHAAAAYQSSVCSAYIYKGLAIH